ncbi:MAG: serine/threonine-protein kinase [Tahibacter sp.]
MKRPDRDFDVAATALADEQGIDWAPLLADNDADGAALEGLRLLEDVARAFRDTGAQSTAPAPGNIALFHWGTLDVCAPLGRGACGEVWRAYDPALQRDVALKLRPEGDVNAVSNAEFLAEARHLARLRHRHVLAVYGAGLNDGRAGLWTELVEGRTLASVVAQDGSLAPAEALRISHELATALVVIHGAGLIHGDVKAENVMREPGGRSVLMDFGAAGNVQELAARSVLQATPRYLPPEVRDGSAPVTPAVDLYALGVLLHFLLSGRYPDPAQPLDALRPDLGTRTLRLVESALATDPAARPPDARQFAARLATLALPVQARGIRLGLALGASALMLALLALAGLAWHTDAPMADWHAEAAFMDPDKTAPHLDGAALMLGEEIALNYRANQASFVYVLNADDSGEVHVLFPVAELDQGNPLPAGEHQLPGTTRGQALAWRVDGQAKWEEFVALASPVRLAGLEARLQAAHSARIAQIGTERSVGSLAPRAPLPTGLRGAALRELVAQAQAEQPRPGTVLLWILQAPHAR